MTTAERQVLFKMEQTADEDKGQEFSIVTWNGKSCRVECDVARLDR